MSQSMTVSEAYRSVKESAETIRVGEPQNFPEAASVGDAARQGDIYITKMEDDVDMSGCMTLEQLKARTTFANDNGYQLVEGNSVGSQHVLAGDFTVKIREGDVLQGPVIRVGEGGATVKHPTHAHVNLVAGDTYGITFQRKEAEERRRVQD